MRSFAVVLLAVLVVAPVLQAQSPQDFLTQANQLVASYQWQEALRLLDRANSKYPDDTELNLRYAYLLIRTGAPAKASELLRRSAALHPRDAQILAAFGEARTALGDHVGAIEILLEAERQKPGDAAILHQLALAQLLVGKTKEALATARRAVVQGKVSAETRRLYALLLNLDGQVEESHRQLKHAIADQPHNASLLFEMSEAKRVNGKLGEALEYADMAIEADPENPMYHSGLARLYRQIKQPQPASEAQANADKLLKAFASYTQAVSLASKGSIAKAIQMLEPAVTANPTFVTGRLFLADLETRRGDRKRALELYQEAMAQDPTRLEAREKSAWLRTEQGDLHSALELLHGSPQSVQNQILTRAYLYMTRTQWAEALQELQQVELSSPLNYQLLKLMSTCYREQGKMDQALAYLERARQAKPDDPEAIVILREIRTQQAATLLDRGDWPGAMGAYKKLASDDPSSSYLVLNLAYARERGGDLEAAIQDYRRGLRLDPRALWARKNLAACLLRLRRFNEAVTEWESVVRSEKTSDSLLHLGICYANLDRNAEAEQVLEKALAKGRASGELLYNIGVTKMRLRKTEEGWDFVRRAGRKGYQPAQDLIAKAATRANK